MTLTIKTDDDSCKKKVECHMLPCNINVNKHCNVTKYFSVKEGQNSLLASFRGYPLEGQKVPVPENYIGVVLRENKLQDSEDRELRATASFNEIHVWNWDKNPAIENKLQTAYQWIDVASILHKPVSECDDLPSSPQKQRKRKLDN